MSSRGDHGKAHRRATAFVCVLFSFAAMGGEVTKNVFQTASPESVMSLFGLGELTAPAIALASGMGESLSFRNADPGAKPNVPKGRTATAEPVLITANTQGSEAPENVDVSSALGTNPQGTEPSSGNNAQVAPPSDAVISTSSPDISESKTGEQSGVPNQREDELTRALGMVGNTLRLSQYLPKALQGASLGAQVPDLTTKNPETSKQLSSQKKEKQNESEPEDKEAQSAERTSNDKIGTSTNNADRGENSKNTKDSKSNQDEDAEKAKQAQDRADKKAKEDSERQEKLKDLLSAPFKDNEKTDMKNYHLLADAFQQNPRGVLRLLDADKGAREMAKALVDNFGSSGKILPDVTNQARARLMSGMLVGTIPDTGSFVGAPTGTSRASGTIGGFGSSHGPTGGTNSPPETEPSKN